MEYRSTSLEATQGMSSSGRMPSARLCGLILHMFVFGEMGYNPFDFALYGAQPREVVSLRSG